MSQCILLIFCTTTALYKNSLYNVFIVIHFLNCFSCLDKLWKGRICVLFIYFLRYASLLSPAHLPPPQTQATSGLISVTIVCIIQCFLNYKRNHTVRTLFSPASLLFLSIIILRVIYVTGVYQQIVLQTAGQHPLYGYATFGLSNHLLTFGLFPVSCNYKQSCYEH